MLLDPKEVLTPKLTALTQQRALLQQAQTQAVMQKLLKTQFEQWVKEQAKTAAALETLYSEFKQEDNLVILCRLKDEEPLSRWMAVQVAQSRWEKLENFLVELLEDPAPMVRQAAHQALVKLSRGNDFGPVGPNPTTTQIRNAQKQWRGYLEVQERGP